MASLEECDTGVAQTIHWSSISCRGESLRGANVDEHFQTRYAPQKNSDTARSDQCAVLLILIWNRSWRRAWDRTDVDLPRSSYSSARRKGGPQMKLR
jgi:hypothetical protein